MKEQAMFHKRWYVNRNRCDIFSLGLLCFSYPSRCLEECPRLYSNGVTGRICDDTCSTGEFGYKGCSAKNGIFGTNCRECYVDPYQAYEEDDIEHNERAIM